MTESLTPAAQRLSHAIPGRSGDTWPPGSGSTLSASLRKRRQLARLILVVSSLWQLSGLAYAENVPVIEATTTFVDRINFSVDRTGVIADVPDEGERISAGDVVVQLRDEVPRATLAVAQAEAQSDVQIRVAEKTAEATKVEYDAAVKVNESSGTTVPAYPPTHITRLKLNSEAADLKVTLAEHEKRVHELSRDQAQAELDTFQIVAHLGGLVTEVYKRQGEGVQQGEPIVQVVNTDRLRVEGYVTVANSFLIKPGMPVSVRFQLPETAGPIAEKDYTGRLGFVDVTVSQLSDRCRVWAEIDNSAGELREGLNATMTIQTTGSAPGKMP